MRWRQQELTADDPQALPGLGRLAGLVRSVRTPEFAGVTFHEVHCRSALNKVPGPSPMPFGWTVNPYRGCTHGCRYCFARRSHEYLEFDSGHDFDTQIVVKTNIGAVLRREVTRPGWRREHVAMGTNTDPYQRAEGRYALMPDIIRALSDSGTPFSILTKGTVLARDLPLLAAAHGSVPVGVGVSLALLDPELQHSLEPGTPSPQARLKLIERITAAGLPCGVFVAPVLPYLTDSDQQLTELVTAIAAAGATGISRITLDLGPGAREWFSAWLAEHRPDLVPRYRALYGAGSNLRRELRAEVSGRIRRICDRLGLGSFGQELRGVPGSAESRFPAGSLPPRDRPAPPDAQPALF